MKLPKKERIKLILEELERLYPNPKPELYFTNPFEALVATMLSAQCTDKQVNKVTPKVFELYPNAQAMAECTYEELYPLVRSCGFASKAKNIISTSKLLCENHKGEVPNDMEALQKLPGVGRKTANVVMANAFNVPSIAVDTHVFRVSNRLGIAKADNVLKTELQLRKAIPKEKWRDAHHWLILHGRRICAARKAKCDICTLNSWCNFYN